MNGENNYKPMEIKVGYLPEVLDDKTEVEFIRREHLDEYNTIFWEAVGIEEEQGNIFEEGEITWKTQ